MFALLVIVFLVAFPFAIDAATSGSLAALATPAVLIAGFLVYFAPTIAAGQRGHLSANAIFIVNLFFGWTLLGWLIALIWRSRPSIAESSLSRAASRFGWKIIEPRLADYALRRSLYDRRPEFAGAVDAAARDRAWRDHARIGKVFGETIGAIE